MLWIILIFFIIAAGLYFAWRFGLLMKFSMEKGRLMGSEILYLPYKGDYHKLGPLFEEVTRNMQAVFKFSQNFGFYFDNPEVTPAEKCRAIVGIMVNEGEEFKIKDFCAKFQGYKRAYLDTTRCIMHEMPFVNMLSIILMVKNVYPKIQQHLKKQDIDESDCFGMMEIYKCVSSQMKIQVLLPLNNREQFMALLPNQNQENQVQEQPRMNV